MDINRYSPSYSIKPKHMLNIGNYTTEDIFEILYATKAMKARHTANESTLILQGTTVALLFGDTSLRTRSALEIGIRQLGAVCVNLPYAEADMRAGENIKDIVNVICRYGVGAIITRGIGNAELEGFCEVSQIPIINSNNADGVPMQTLCDLFTIWEKKKKLENLKIAYVGKGCSNALSLITGCIKCGMHVSLSTPQQFKIDDAALENVLQYGEIEVCETPAEAVKNADIVYTDGYSYHSPISEAEKKALKPFQVNNSMMGAAAHGALFMHPLPANRGLEVTAEVIDGKYSLVLDQGENKLHTVKAIMALLIK